MTNPAPAPGLAEGWQLFRHPTAEEIRPFVGRGIIASSTAGLTGFGGTLTDVKDDCAVILRGDRSRVREFRFDRYDFAINTED